MIRKGRSAKPAAEIAQRYGESARSIGVFTDMTLQGRLLTPERSRGQESSQTIRL
jgi:hypothetical protein